MWQSNVCILYWDECVIKNGDQKLESIAFETQNQLGL